MPKGLMSERAEKQMARNEEKAREKVTYELQRVAVLDKVRDQAKITYVDAVMPATPERTQPRPSGQQGRPPAGQVQRVPGVQIRACLRVAGAGLRLIGLLGQLPPHLGAQHGRQGGERLAWL